MKVFFYKECLIKERVITTFKGGLPEVFSMGEGGDSTELSL